MTAHLRVLLDAAARDPDAPIARLPLLADDERADLAAWNATRAPPPESGLVHAAVEAQARLTPHAVAVLHEGRALTYAELNARANQLARHLRAAGVGPDGRVGLLLERSLDLSVAILAVLKAGAAYVPLDPAYPAERLRYMVENAGARVILAHARLAPTLPPLDARVLHLDGLDVSAHPAHDLPHDATPDCLAYVIYTSGSTGRPKGVAMPHGALANLLAWQRSVWPSTPTRILQFASPSFDVSFQETFTAWTTGGTLVLVPEEARRDPGMLLDHLAKHQVEALFLPPAVLRVLAPVARARPDVVASLALTQVVTAGEQLVVDEDVAWLVEALPAGCALVNHYGPSETHVVTAHVVRARSDARAPLGNASIGRPIANARVHVLDGEGSPVPVGVPGELHIGGAQVARGYLDRPDLTAERFVPDPFSGEAGARLYRTGDLARWRSDGTIEFLGRTDHQVKVRGYRIEPGEVEAALAAHPAVRACVAMAREDVPGDKRLVAYVVPDEGHAAPTAADLREHLRRSLPEHMIPSAFVPLPALPLTPNGKVDRRALPAPEPGAEDARAYVPPSTPVEEVLAGIWSEVLRVERVGANDHFFEMGGHSLLATRVVTKVKEAFGLDLPLRALFARPRLAELAEDITQRLIDEVAAVTDEEAARLNALPTEDDSP